LQLITHKSPLQLNLSRVNGPASSVNPPRPASRKFAARLSSSAICFLHLGLLANSGHDTFHATRFTGNEWWFLDLYLRRYSVNAAVRKMQPIQHRCSAVY
jgi:hypothetical protein